jgi:hypothetical protein
MKLINKTKMLLKKSNKVGSAVDSLEKKVDEDMKLLHKDNGEQRKCATRNELSINKRFDQSSEYVNELKKKMIENNAEMMNNIVGGEERLWKQAIKLKEELI